jgi:AAA15 family ATPase/GTPase
MIISFSIENWMSFRDLTTFSMIANLERQHKNRVRKLRKYNTHVLPIAVIYGGNASGKTNFFRALNFAKRLIVDGTKPDNLIAVKPFELDTTYANKPSRFIFEILIEDTIFEFSFVVTKKSILEEKLVEILATSEKVLYHRKNNQPNFSKSLDKDKFLHFAFQGTRDNQLFLYNSVSQQVNTFKPIYDWFKNTLELVSTDSKFSQFEHFLDRNHFLYNKINELLPQLDTGITRLDSEEILLESVDLPLSFINHLEEEVKEGGSVKLIGRTANERLIITRIDGELIAKKLISYHLGTDNEKIKFEINQESDGTQRLIDLLPAFVNLYSKSSNKVYIIDEFDRSFHTLLARTLLENYLSICNSESKSQLLITTHDLLIMDQELLRRDEIWIAERDQVGASKLFSFSDFKKLRSDKDIRKSYLQGRLGGLPRILL